MTALDGNRLITLLNAATGDTGTLEYWAGGEGTIFVSGTFDTATVTLEWASASNGTPRVLDDDADSVSFTAPGARNFKLPPGWIRADMASPGTEAITVEVQRIPL